jgi:hypothetical protein
MEETNFSENFVPINDSNSNNLEKETLIGWSAACLDEAISFYIDCNCSNILIEGSSESE